MQKGQKGKVLFFFYFTTFLSAIYCQQYCTVFENTRKSLILLCKQSEQRLHFEKSKYNKNTKKMVNLVSFLKPKAFGQIVLPNRSLLKGQKWAENDKTENFKCDILGNFQPICYCYCHFLSSTYFNFFGLSVMCKSRQKSYHHLH